jgi:hypothetical protein
MTTIAFSRDWATVLPSQEKSKCECIYEYFKHPIKPPRLDGISSFPQGKFPTGFAGRWTEAVFYLAVLGFGLGVSHVLGALVLESLLQSCLCYF